MIIIAFALYLGLMMYIGVYYYRKSNSIGDYILGGRQLGPWITALSAEASDMSGWMLMGVPGLAYTTGISGVWIAVGLTLGTWANWRFVSRRLRNHTEVASDSLTLPDYLKNRFHDQIPFGSCYFRIVYINLLPHLHILWICGRRQIIQYHLRFRLYGIPLYYGGHCSILYLPRRFPRRILDGLYSRGVDVLRHLGCTYYGSHVLRWSY